MEEMIRTLADMRLDLADERAHARTVEAEVGCAWVERHLRLAIEGLSAAIDAEEAESLRLFEVA